MQKLVGCRNVVQWAADVAFNEPRMTIHLHMEYYRHGDLSGLIRSRRGELVTKDTVTQIFVCMAMALLDCHSRGICHRDIKPQNSL
jgi:serine/threonine protein kinase